MSQLPENDLLFTLYDVARLMRVRADQRANLTGITRAQWVVLVWLERRPGITQQELASLVEVEPITIARLVDRLEARQCVERRLDPNDRRVRRLHLLPDAKPLLKEIHAYRRALERMVTAGLPKQDVACVLNALNAMKTNLLDEKRDYADSSDPS